MLTGHIGAVQALALSSDGKFIVSGSDDNTIKKWSVLEQKENLL